MRNSAPRRRAWRAIFQALDGGVEPALVAAAVTLAYRVIAAIA